MSVWFKKSFLDWSEILLLALLFFCVRVLYLASAGASFVEGVTLINRQILNKLITIIIISSSSNL